MDMQQHKFTNAEKVFLDRAALAMVENPEMTPIAAMQAILQRDRELFSVIVHRQEEKIAIMQGMAEAAYAYARRRQDHA